MMGKRKTKGGHRVFTKNGAIVDVIVFFIHFFCSMSLDLVLSSPWHTHRGNTDCPIYVSISQLIDLQRGEGALKDDLLSHLQ